MLEHWRIIESTTTGSSRRLSSFTAVKPCSKSADEWAPWPSRIRLLYKIFSNYFFSPIPNELSLCFFLFHALVTRRRKGGRRRKKASPVSNQVSVYIPYTLAWAVCVGGISKKAFVTKFLKGNFFLSPSTLRDEIE